MQVDEDVWLYQLLVDDIEQLLVEPEFFFGQVHFGEEQTFGEEIIADGDGVEEITGLDQFFQLFVSFGHEEQLQRKGVLAGAFVELAEKGIVGKCFEDQSGIVFLGKQMGQGCFTRADIAFDCNEVIFHGMKGQNKTIAFTNKDCRGDVEK